MADNGTASSNPTVAWDDIGAVAFQRVKLVHGIDGVNDGDVSGVNGLPVRPSACSSVTISRVNDSATSVVLRGAAATRRGLILYNDSSAYLFLKYGSTASAVSFSYKIDPGGHWEMPAPIYLGTIDGIWSAFSGGAAQMTELL